MSDSRETVGKVLLVCSILGIVINLYQFLLFNIFLTIPPGIHTFLLRTQEFTIYLGIIGIVVSFIYKNKITIGLNVLVIILYFAVPYILYGGV